MKKFISILIFFFAVCFSTNSQTLKFGWITDLHIGSPNADSDLAAAVNDINQRTDIEFVVATGDIAEKGRNEELIKAKEILDKLVVPYYIIPGNHDTKWSESGCTIFSELWGDDKFSFEKSGTKFIGINSGIPWRGGGGHAAPEDLRWLKEELEKGFTDREILFFVHHPLDEEIDNWYKVTNLLRDYNVKAVFYGHGHSNKLSSFNDIPAAMGRSTLSRDKSWGYTLAENKSDSLFFFEINKNPAPKFWGAISKTNQLSISKIDSTEFEDYTSSMLWTQALETTLSAPLLTADDKVFAAAKNGTIYCFNLKGKLLWKYETYGSIFSRPAYSSGILVAGTIEGDLFSFDVRTGELIQVIGLGESITSQLITIEAENYGEKTTGVIVGTAGGALYCYDLFSFDQIWVNRSAGGMIEAEPLYINKRIIFGSWDNYLYCVDAKSGILNWRWTENKNFYYSPAACSPVSDGKYVFISTPDKFISAVDLLLGVTAWRKNDFNGWESLGISSDKKFLLVKSLMDKFFIVNASNGKLGKEITIGFGLDTMPVKPIEWNGNIIFGSKNGIVYLINQKYNFKKILFTGTARVHTVRHIKDNLFAASNMDGRIVVFEIR